VITIVVVLSCIAIYCWAGIRLVAKPFVTTQVANHIRDYPTLAAKPGNIDAERRDMAGFGLALAVIWPAALVWRLLISGLVASAPLSDVEVQEQLKQRDRRVAELERELGMCR
jgi:hypothetical protein